VARSSALDKGAPIRNTARVECRAGPHEDGEMSIAIYVDADACPVKDEVYRVARRLGLHVWVVSNRWVQVPQGGRVELVLVKGDLDAADDWIAEHVDAGDLVVTADIPLAARCLKRGALVLSPRGHPFTEDSIGDAVATRDLKEQLREAGTMTAGPPPFTQRDRSRFLARLDELYHAAKRLS
jgi:uncharacterized protein